MFLLRSKKNIRWLPQSYLEQGLYMSFSIFFCKVLFSFTKYWHISYFSTKTYVVVTHYKHIAEVLLMSAGVSALTIISFCIFFSALSFMTCFLFSENFLGEALVYCEDLQKNPSSRQIIPLQGRLGAGEFVSGSITVEVRKLLVPWVISPTTS